MQKSTLLVRLGAAAAIVAGASLTACATPQAAAKTEEKAKEGSCGGEKAKEGSCGGEKAKEGSCGGEKAKEGSCGGEKAKEGSCGEGSCGGAAPAPAPK